MFRKFLLPPLAAGMLFFAIFHVVRAQQLKPRAEPPAPPAQTPFEHTVAGVGVLEAETGNIGVCAPLAGIVAEVFVQAGQPVEARAPLFRLDDRSLRAELKLREASLAVAKTQLAKLESLPRPEELPASAARVREAQANVVDKEAQYHHGQELFAKKVIGSEQLTQRKQALAVAREQLARAQADQDLLRAGAAEADKDVARAVVAQAQAQVEQAQTELERLLVRSPERGTVLQVNIRIGEDASALHGKAPVVVGNLRPLHVRVDFDANDIPRFQPHAPARALVRGNPQRQWPLQFVRVEPLVVSKRVLTGDITERADTRVLQVIYALDPGEQTIYAGQLVDVFIDYARNGKPPMK